MLYAIGLFVIIFSLLILFHEWGHFYSARRLGLKVDEFGIGFPPRITGFKKQGVIYSINWIPFGGFVKLHGDSSEAIDDRDAFINKTPGQRMAVLFAGVAMNFLIAWVLLMIGFWFKMPPLATSIEKLGNNVSQIESQVVAVKIIDNTPAQTAGLIAGDYILSADGQEFANPDDLKKFLVGKAGKQIDFTIKRRGEPITVTITPVESKEGTIIGAFIDQSVEKVAYVWWKVPWLAAKEIFVLIWLIIQAIAGLIYQLFTKATIPTDLSGPVGIARIAIDLMQLGWMRIMQFVIFLSLNLGVINLVPFPGLDGGRMVFVLLEFLRGGKKLSGSIENAIHTVGFMLIVLLVLVVTYKDVLKII